MPTRTMVVPCESRAQIISDPDVVSGRVDVTTNDVNDAFLDAVHVMDDACIGPTGIVQEIEIRLRRVRRCVYLERADALLILRCGPPSLAQSLASYGETAFAR